MSLAGGPDVMQTLAADATGKMSVELSRGVSGAANQSLMWLGGLAAESGGLEEGIVGIPRSWAAAW